MSFTLLPIQTSLGFCGLCQPGGSGSAEIRCWESPLGSEEGPPPPWEKSHSGRNPTLPFPVLATPHPA